MDSNIGQWQKNFDAVFNKAKSQSIPVYIVTADNKKVDDYFNKQHNMGVQVYTCDGTAIKTAPRANPTVVEMKGPVVQGKYSWADLDAILK